MQALLRPGRGATADLPLRLLAGVALAALVLGTTVTAAESARASALERAGREAIGALEAAIDGVLSRTGSRSHFSIDSPSLPLTAELVLDRPSGERPALVASIRAEGRTLARSLLCENCDPQWGGGGANALIVPAGTPLVLSSSATGSLLVEVARS
jgi:hypothetical protein